MRWSTGTCRFGKPFVARALLPAVSILALNIAQAPVQAQTYEEPPTAAPTVPDPAGSVPSTEVTVPRGSPDYLAETYRSAMKAPLPAKIWKQGGIPKVIRQDETFNNPHGKVGNHNQPGQVITANNGFFQSLGENGRSCVTCHLPPSGMGMSVKNVKARFRANLNDPLFAPVDGANCPDAVPPQYTSGALVGGRKGMGKRALRDAYSLLLNKGLIRVFLPVPSDAEFTVDLVSDAPGCNKNPAFNVDPKTGAKILSMYRRPIISANMRFKVPNDAENAAPTNVMWDGREPNLHSQAISATLGHAQAKVAPSPAKVQEIVDFETKFFSAQLVARVAGRLDAAPATGGPRHLSQQDPDPVIPPFPAPPPVPFDEYAAWAPLTGNAKAQRQASIARGEAIFNGAKTFTIANVAGLNDFEVAPGVTLGNPAPFPGTCSACHGKPNAGSELVFPPQRDIGTGGQAAPNSFDGPTAVSGPGVGPLPAGDLPIFKFTCTGTSTHPFYGKEIITNDPGPAMITGKCKDIGKKTVPQIRSLAARAPYFSDGSAKNLRAVVEFYDKRFKIDLTEQDKQDLTNFMAAL